MGRLAVRDRLCPVGRHCRKLVQEGFSLGKCGLELEQSREPFPRLVVSIVVYGFKSLFESLQKRARKLRGLNRSDRLEPLLACTFKALDLQRLNLFVRKR